MRHQEHDALGADPANELEDPVERRAVDEVYVVDHHQQRQPAGGIEQLAGNGARQPVGIGGLIPSDVNGKLPEHSKRYIPFLGGTEGVDHPRARFGHLSRKGDREFRFSRRDGSRN
nr:hypothetical protein [Streptomyces radicis]